MLVKELIHDDDTDNQVLNVIYKMGLQATKWMPGEYVSGRASRSRLTARRAARGGVSYS